MTVFRWSTDSIGRAAESVAPQVRGGIIEVEPDVVTVTLGDPPMFRARIPRSKIKAVERVPDLTNPTRGVHGWRGKWLVNASGENLVRLRMTSAVPASLEARTDRIEGYREPENWFVRRLVRWITKSRVLRLEELTLSVDEPGEFIKILGGAGGNAAPPVRSEENVMKLTVEQAEQKARELLDDNLSGRWEAVSKDFDDTMLAGLSEAKMSEALGQITQQMGTFVSSGEPSSRSDPGYLVVDIPAEFERGALKFRVSFDNEGKVAGLFFLNPAAP
ncbi:MAG TPA: DUF3887 domain-containing protein [Actinomycetota bacterium]|nr:DUF3887 domain-containing protein [Actinomycetota bacterium]